MSSPVLYKEVKIRDVAEINPGANRADDDACVTFLAMPAVSESGQIVNSEIRKFAEVKKGFTAFAEDDVLVAKITPCFENGKGCLAKNLVGGIGFGSTEFHVLRPQKNQISPDYLNLITRTHSFRGTGELNMTGTAGQKRVPTIFVKNYKFLLPPIFLQKKITDIFSIWDNAIEKTERLIAVKGTVKKGLMQRLLFGKGRLGGRKNGEPKEGKWFSTPSDWKRVKIGSISKEISKKNTNGDDLPVLSCTKYQGLVISLEYFDKQIFSIDTSTYKIVEHGQFAYATNHIEEGSIGYQDLYPKGLISPMYTVFKADPNKINDGFLYKLLKTETFRRIFAINTNASVDRRGSLRWKDFAKLPIPLPGLPEQEEINQVLDAAQQEIILLQKKLDLLKTQKRGLMQKLLTGQWQVKKNEEK